MVRIATEKRLLFKQLVPKDRTIAAVEAACGGDLGRVGVVEGLMANFNADD